MGRICQQLINEVVRPGLCTGCGACVALDGTGESKMEDTDKGPLPTFGNQTVLPELAWNACPGKGLPYPDLYEQHYGQLPENWLLGQYQKVYIGHSGDEAVRRGGASGGVLSHALVYLLESGRVDGAIVVGQGDPVPEKARVRVARSRADILACAGSVYIPVSTLDILRDLPEGSYAMTCLPDQAAALRVLQQAGFEPAMRVKFVLGPYTGTALYPAAIRSFLRSRGVKADDPVVSLKWRAGEWPGYLEIITGSGKRIRAQKFYYNYLIPFFVTQASLQSMDFTNEFCDLSVGDAWSPVYEDKGEGFSVVTSRSETMDKVLMEMQEAGHLQLTKEDPEASLSMHGHMLDFKKRGSYIRNRTRRCFGLKSPDYGMQPHPLPVSRVLVECFIMMIFTLARTGVARTVVSCIPERVIGPMFNGARKSWKAMSKPTKRKGLIHLNMVRDKSV